MQHIQSRIILAVGAHPDDIDFYASGTLADFIEQGATVFYLVLTDGSKGTEDASLTPEQLRDMRQDEQHAAAKLIGVRDVFFLEYPDGLLENTTDLKRDIVRHIRQLKPDTVITLDPTMVYSIEQGQINHPDHRAAGQAVLDAVYPLARDHLIFPDLKLEPHKVAQIVLCNSPNPNFTVDITKRQPLKQQILAAHTSQPGLRAEYERQPDPGQERFTLISVR